MILSNLYYIHGLKTDCYLSCGFIYSLQRLQELPPFSNIIVRNGLQFQAMIIIIIIILFIIKEAGCQAMIDLVDRMAEQ